MVNSKDARIAKVKISFHQGLQHQYQNAMNAEAFGIDSIHDNGS